MFPKISDIIIIIGITGELEVTSSKYDSVTMVTEYTLTSLDPMHPFTTIYTSDWFANNSNLWWHAVAPQHVSQSVNINYIIPVVGDEVTFSHGTGIHKVIFFDSKTDEFTIEDVSSMVKWTFKITLEWFKQNQGLWALAKPLSNMQLTYGLFSPAHNSFAELTSGNDKSFKNIIGIGEDKDNCTNHQWKAYQGIYESFDYCTICDVKKKD